MNDVSTPYYKILDLTLILSASICAYWFRFNELFLPLEYLLPATVFAIIATYSLSITRFYETTNSSFNTKRLFSIASGLAIAAALTASCLYLTKTGESYSRIWFVTTILLGFCLILLSREVLRRFFHVSIGKKSIILVGGNQTANRTAERLTKPASQIEGITLLKHFSSTDPGVRATQLLHNVAEFVEQSLRKNPETPVAKEIWLTSDVFNSASIAEIEIILSDTSAAIVYIPEIPALEELEIMRFESIVGIPTLNSGFTKSRKINSVLKFLEDRIGASLLILLLSPIFLLLAILIKLDSKGPVFFKQVRHGFGGSQFEIFKFRTMSACESSDEFVQATQGDARVTRVGYWLRRLSLDELPQLFNVLNGTMSLVGPRPHPLKLNEQYRDSINSYMTRHAVKPGITGLAQVNGFRGETSEPWMMENRIRCDLEYVKNWSIVLDIKIIAMTVIHLFTTNKAY